MIATKIVRTRDGSVVKIGSQWDTGDVHDLDGNLVEEAMPVELLDVDIPDIGNAGTATVMIGEKTTTGPMIIRDNHPGLPGQRVAFLEI